MFESSKHEMRFIRFIIFLHKSSLIHTEPRKLNAILSTQTRESKGKRQPDFIACQTKPKGTKKILHLHLSTAKSQSWAHFCYFLFVAKSQDKDGKKTTTIDSRKSLVQAYSAKNLIHTFVFFIETFYVLAHWKHQNSRKYYYFIDFQCKFVFLFSFGPIISKISHLSLLRKSDCTSEKWRMRVSWK